MIGLLTDEHIPAALVAALLARGLDVVRAEDVGLKGEDDPDVLAWAAAEGRILVTFDRRTVPGFAYDRATAGLPMPGVAIPDSV